ncbi:sensor histidine kinase [Ruminiclostridium cellobioparum]|uniref:histidine kinase n=1 Tax=Ruminiclostridium cellobioparum subsp. termitidis CT1112 TaxID=1195236 RepID=S0FGD9_RUMCE|nr:HAMP domain-containing sensor histidine kinase [Ruminiclostridium cellobioparum]EMS70460.1 His Kinase A (phosphoacceptor) domain/Histidine kinase-, DNA gyrase B-, and HSP90-like ATPase [Ruminiclostridium cellobioparum subsp. termitidis CT1112]
MNFNRKIAVIVTLFITVNLVYLFYGIIISKSFIEIIINVCLMCFEAAAGFIFYTAVKKQMQDVFLQLSEVIAAITDMRETEIFSVLDDNMLSKLQSQVIKLSGILKMQNSKLEKEKNEIKSLISDIAHQLKNPLSNLNLYISFLKDRCLDESSRQEYVNNISNQLEKLNWLMESMIKMSRLESGIIQLKPEESSVNELLLTSLKQVYHKAERKGMDMEFIPDEDIKLTADIKWTSEAITNILENAVKYTGDGGRIAINVYKYEMYARIDIRDNGPGFEEAEINNIFKRFYRGPNARQQDGAGIGLYLSREIVTRQNGYIKVKSKPGEGSIFSVFLLLKR